MTDAAPPRVLETCLYAEDLDAAARFYGEALGLEMIQSVEDRHRFFRAAGGMVFLFNPLATAIPAPADAPIRVPPHGAHGPGHVCFSAEGPGIEGWAARLAEHGIEIETRIEWPNGAISIYCRDPAGNSVEFAEPKIWGL